MCTQLDTNLKKVELGKRKRRKGREEKKMKKIVDSYRIPINPELY